MHVEVRAVEKRFGDLRVLKGCSLTLERGEVVSLLGPSGCGKTTLLRCIAGFAVPDSGSIVVDGKDITTMPPNRRRVGLVFQNYALFPHLTVAENVAYGLTVRRKPAEEIERRTEEALALVSLADLGARYPAELSGGQQQRVALARAVILEPEILLLDEPFNALDAKLRGTMQVELRKLVKQLGMTSLFVTHDQTEALTLSDRVAVMREGDIEQLAPPLTVYDEPKSSYVAGFIGNTNLLRREASNGRVEIGPGIRVATAEEGSVHVIARPENLILQPASEGPRALAGVVTFVRPLGATVEYQVDAGTDGSLLVVDLREAHSDLFEVGDNVAIAVRTPEACAVLAVDPA